VSLNVKFFGTQLLSNQSISSFQPVSDKPNIGEMISVEIYVINRHIIFQFFEKIIGSEFQLIFFGNEGIDINRSSTKYNTEYFVRDIPVKSNTYSYYVLSYSKLWWNFMSPQSDKILSLTREKFINKNKLAIEVTFTNEVLKQALE